MDRTIKLLAASSVVMLTMTACAPGYSPYGSTGTGSTYNENYGGSGGTTKAPVTHSHGGKVHSHALPSTGLRHTHATGSGYGGTGSGYTGGYGGGNNTYVPPRQPYPQTQYNPGNNNGGVPHSHCGRVHSHPLPAQGLAHTHGNPACPAGPASGGQQGGTQQGGQYGGQQQGNNSGYDYAYGNNNAGSGTTYDYTGQAGNAGSNADNGGYYNYGGSGSGNNNQTYYDSTQPKAPSNYYDNNSNTNYDYSSPSSSGSSNSGSYDSYTGGSSGGNANSGSFAPNNYSGGNSYTVKRGDTVFQVMRNTGVYWKDIIRLNNLQAPNYQINPGQVLRLK
ncbi:MAG: LysM peptidoglycan-binding domain-containing protein [Thiothrix sp.]|nr:MAG: LysM peptidoglycan-binding domain-containing protein [Thiothrix sp.]